MNIKEYNRGNVCYSHMEALQDFGSKLISTLLSMLNIIMVEWYLSSLSGGTYSNIRAVFLYY